MQVFSKRKSALYSAGFLFTREHLLYDEWGNRWFIMLHGFFVKKFFIIDFLFFIPRTLTSYLILGSIKRSLFYFCENEKNIELARRKTEAYFSRA